MNRQRKDWQSRLEAVMGTLDSLSDSVRLRLRKITGFEPLMIIPYLGYGTSDKLLVHGRVLEDEGFSASGDADTNWQNLVNMFRRFETDEVPGARIRAVFQDAAKEVIANHEGYFRVEMHPVRELDSHTWQQVEVELLDPPLKDGQRLRTAVQVLVPSATARFGTISDIDDTILSTHVANKLKMILTVALLNEHTRMPFNGVAAFYRALQEGASGSEQNPIFYVSSSPWNLYSLLVEFLRVQGIPIGPLLLKDFGDHLLFSSSDHYSHKMSNIGRILETFPQLPFILIGDSGEQDPEIYREIVRKYPDRIRVIYIRSVNRQPSRLVAIDELIAEVQQTGSQLVLAPDSEFAAAHAAAEGLISTGQLSMVRSEQQKDKNAPSEEEVATVNIG